jgi:hypothetical protein
VFPADGLDYEICFGSGYEMKVSRVWDSPEQMAAFGARVHPILEELGIDHGLLRYSKYITSSDGQGSSVTDSGSAVQDIDRAKAKASGTETGLTERALATSASSGPPEHPRDLPVRGSAPTP